MLSVVMRPIDSIAPNPHNARTHSKKQIGQIEKSIREYGFLVPVLIDENSVLIAGHGRLQAARQLGMRDVPTITVEGLTPARKRALMLADNKIAQNAGWDRERLAIELPELAPMLLAEGSDISITGFEAVEFDQLVADFEENSSDPADELPPPGPAVSRKRDMWILGKHRILCGDAREASDLKRLLGDDQASAAFLDPPYNVKVSSIGGRGRKKHAEFAMASGEMERSEFVGFLKATLSLAAGNSRPGAVHFVCMDWRHIGELVEAGRDTYQDMLNMVVWDKTNAGQGNFYRSQHEFIGVFRVGSEPHLNNVELGRHGRSRSNVWRHAGVNTFRKGRLEELHAHPTVKPVGLVAEALKDCTRRDDLVLDTFGGSGTTLLAAERVGRRAALMEIEPKFVDVTIRRWQVFTGRDAVHAETGATFDETASMLEADHVG